MMTDELEYIQKLLLEFYKTVPFHNLWLLEGKRQNPPGKEGGTCTDKTIYFQKILEQNNIQFKLHNAFINNIPCHRILIGKIDGRSCIIDVGDGAPLINPIFFGENSEFSYYGYQFIQKSKNEIIEIYHQKPNGLFLSFYTKNEEIPNELIWRSIEDDFTNEQINPFHRCLRFSKVVGNKFYRLEDDILKIGKSKKIKKVKIHNLYELKKLFNNVFNYNFHHVKSGLDILIKRGITIFKD